MLRTVWQRLMAPDKPDPDLERVRVGVLARLADAESSLAGMQRQLEQTREDVPEVRRVESRLLKLEAELRQLPRDTAHELERLEAAVREIRGRQTGGMRRGRDPEAQAALEAVQAAQRGDTSALGHLLGVQIQGGENAEANGAL